MFYNTQDTAQILAYISDLCQRTSSTYLAFSSVLQDHYSKIYYASYPVNKVNCTHNKVAVIVLSCLIFLAHVVTSFLY